MRLQAEDRLRVSELLRALEDIPMAEFRTASEALVGGTRELLDACDVAVMLVSRDPALPDDDPLGGWRLGRLLQFYEDPAVGRRMERAARDHVYVDDPHSQAMAAGAGSHRAVLRYEAVTPEQWRGAPTRQLLEASGIVDQLIGVHALDPDREVYLAVSRMKRPEPFGARERDLMLLLARGLRRHAQRLAMAHGLLADAMLTRREQQTLAWLLRGLSEKEIAAELDLAEPTVHGHVMSLYRKFRVHSRPELMSLWIW